MDGATIIVGIITITIIVLPFVAIWFVLNRTRRLFHRIVKPSAKAKAKAKDERGQMIAEVTRLLEIGEFRRASELRLPLCGHERRNWLRLEAL